MLKTPTKPLTLEDFLKLPETQPASEYIAGEIIQKPMHQGKHSSIQTELAAAINATLKQQKIARAWSELRCTFSGQAIVPDISVFLWERIPRETNGKVANIFNRAPDWAIEILSPEQRQTKVIKKNLRCLQYNTQMGWLIDPEEETVFAYRSQQQPEFLDEPGQQLPVPLFASKFQLTVGELFAWLLD